MSPYYGKHVIGFEHCYDRLLASDFSDKMSTNFNRNDTVLDFKQSRDSALKQINEYDRKLSNSSQRFGE